MAGYSEVSPRLEMASNIPGFFDLFGEIDGHISCVFGFRFSSCNFYLRLSPLKRPQFGTVTVNTYHKVFEGQRPVLDGRKNLYSTRFLPIRRPVSEMQLFCHACLQL